MKKFLTTFFVAALAFAMQSCDKSDNLVMNTSETTVTVTVEGSFFEGKQVQSILESAQIVNGQCQVRVFDNDLPQFLAVTDGDNHVYMLFRGPVTENITINATSTAQALVTFNPLFGPVPNNEHAALMTKAASYTTQYNALTGAVMTMVNNHYDLLGSGNGNMISALGNLLSAMAGDAYDEQTALDQQIDNNSVYGHASYPLMSWVNGGSLFLQTSANCPTYTLSVYKGDNPEDLIYNEVSVKASTKYGFMGYLNPTSVSTYYGEPFEVELEGEDAGIYTFALTCNDESALNDLCTRIVRYSAATAGIEANTAMLSIIVPIIMNAFGDNVDFTNTDIDLPNVILRAYTGMIQQMDSQSIRALLEIDGNWHIASHLATLYTQNATQIDQTLRRVWTIADANLAQYRSITLQASYNNGVVAPVLQN